VRRCPALALGLSCLAGALLSCGPRRPLIRNVLLVSIDTLRADRLSSYGFPRPTTPHIDAVAREGVLFKNAYSPVPVTLPAHCSMLTGTLPPFHGVRDNLHKRLPDSSLTLAEILKPKGFATAAVVSSFVLDRRFNLSQGFDTYDDRFHAVHKIGDISERKGDETTRLATQWLAAHGSEPFFLFIHYYDPHDDYEPPEPFASRWADDAYSGEVAFADHCVGQVLDKLKQLRVYDSTLIVITGDHGEMLGEHGELNHGFFIYESALRVPLVIRVPRATAPSRQVDAPVSLIDIVPTVAALVGAPAPKRTQGVDLSPWLLGGRVEGAGRPLFAETVTPTRYYGASSLLGVIVEGWKYIETTRPELYDLRRDPGETANLFPAEPARAESLGRVLKAVLTAAQKTAAGAEAAGLDEEARRRLESLGYLNRGGTGSEVVFDRSKEDPKDLIGFFRSDRRLSQLVEEKRYAEARVLCNQMLRQRPGFADCHLQMSRIAATEGDLTTAFTAASKAVELSPGSQPARLQLASLLQGRGDLDGAIAQYQKALDGQPDSPEARTRLGLALARKGRLAEAVESYRRALALAPDSAEAHAYLGSALASQGKLDEAIVHFEQALRAKPDHAELHDWLGVALREKGKPEEALVHFQEAVRLAPGLAIAHFNLGRALKQQGKLDEAVRHYRRAIAIDPRLAAAHNSLGSALGSQGRLREAVREFRDALRLQPGDVEAHNNLGLALRMMGQRDQAVEHFRAALSRRPDWPEPMSEIAWILATDTDPKVRDPAEAVRLAGRAADLTARRQPVILDSLAAAYAAAGDFERAAATAQEATALAASGGAAGLAAEIGKRLELYRQKEPFRETGRRSH
jgi:arylsulfatase A-like enzyme/Flp pilus assembly protein TadD